MAEIKSVKIDGESIHFFNSAIYIYESSEGNSLQIDLIITEVALKKYQDLDNLIVEIELDDGRMINSIMHVNCVAGSLPQLNLYTELDDIQEYKNFSIINENDPEFPNIKKGITLEEIRKVEMPNEDIKLKLKLPIDQVEWLAKQKKAVLNELFKEFIYDYWKKQRLQK
ncbi:hypothetical protein JK635_00850 [Neobacillus sp. YIM B02564]|uniref:Uncharacterized protein n=1 Tax=Neobacillus paridis TaxID=2803862 RepID=A0ABS1THR2_9BACI|nr:hypothetical protein [Neobacillus paridis]MBL4950792.1 hypothetical protein [Neobacillus paridis]